MTSKHPKQTKPTDVDLDRNPLIGGSKGLTMAQAGPEDLEDLEGENTIEGDVENDTNAQGGIDKEVVRDRRRSLPRPDRAGPSRHAVLQGRKTHEQQLRILERKADVPDARQLEQELARAEHGGGGKVLKRNARQSEFAVSRAGLNQESGHNKHNRPSRARLKPQS